LGFFKCEYKSDLAVKPDPFMSKKLLTGILVVEITIVGVALAGA
jgi:hypothetical protein